MYIHTHQHQTLPPLDGCDQLFAALRREVLPSIPMGIRLGLKAYDLYVPRQIQREMRHTATHVGATYEEVLLANLIYELSTGIGCTSFSRDGLHCRNLDWGFPSTRVLSATTTVTDVRGAPAGRFVTVGWPGLSGVFTGMAPGRFSVTINFIVDEHDTAEQKVWRALRGAKPVSWQLRHVLEHCRTYDEACAYLESHVPISPAFILITGTRPGESRLFERRADGQPVGGRELSLVTNSWATDTALCPRYAQTRRRLVDRSDSLSLEAGLDVITDNGMVCNIITAHQVAMNPASGEMIVRIPGGRVHRAVYPRD